MIHVRVEGPHDEAAIRQLNLQAFDSPAEADIVDQLRDECHDYLAFVATSRGDVVGHIVFTPVTLDRDPLVGMGLAPMAVAPRVQNRGIGSRLVRHGLHHLDKSNCPFVLVVGHPEYYPRFGFGLASRLGLACQWDDVPDEAFMIRVLDEDAFPPHGGVIRYRNEFDTAM